MDIQKRIEHRALEQPFTITRDAFMSTPGPAGAGPARRQRVSQRTAQPKFSFQAVKTVQNGNRLLGPALITATTRPRR